MHQFTESDHQKARLPEAKQRRRDTFKKHRQDRKDAVLALTVVHGAMPLYISKLLCYSESYIRRLVNELKRDGRIPRPAVAEGKICQLCHRLKPWDEFLVNRRNKSRCTECRESIVIH